jgi:hypothetical protein
MPSAADGGHSVVALNGVTMMRSGITRNVLLGSALLLAAVLPAFADNMIKQQAPSEVTVTKAGDAFTVTTINRRFETDILNDTSGAQGTLYQLLQIEEAKVSNEGPDAEPEPVSAKVKVTAFPLTVTGLGAPRFTIEAEGDAATADGPYLTVTRFGCCVEQPTHAVYSLESGRYLFNATGDGESGQWATLGAQGGWQNERIIAYHAAETAADEAVLRGADNAVVAISYASPTAPLQRLLITAPKDVATGDAVLSWEPKLDLLSSDQPEGTDRIFVDRAGDSKDLFSGITVRLTLDEKTRIEIPLLGDRLSPAGAKLPKGYGIVAVGL